jgi:hypothetical protein
MGFQSRKGLGRSAKLETLPSVNMVGADYVGPLLERWL